MKIPRIAVISLTLAATSLAACSSSKTTSGGSTTAPVSSVVDSTVPATAAAPTVAPATAPPATPAPTTPAPTGPNLYDQVDNPWSALTGHTAPFDAAGVLADGSYWTIYNGGETFTPDVTVYQAFFGEECITKAAELADECLNDIFIVDPPTRDINDLPFATGVHLTVADSNTQLSYWITPDELVQIRASSPSAGAPAGYSFVPFAFLMTVQGGEIVKFEQVWTP